VLDIDTLTRGDIVSVDGEEGVVIAIDPENNEITVETTLADGAVDQITVDCAETWLTFVRTGDPTKETE
jgi:hypothetical protein